MTVISETTVDCGLADDLGTELERTFGQGFTLWAMQEGRWQLVKSPDEYPTDPPDSNSPSVKVLAGNQVVVTIPLEVDQTHFLAQSVFAGHDAELLDRLVQAFLRQLSSRRQIAELRAEGEELARQVTHDFERLAFLQEVADRLRLYSGSEDFRQVAEMLLPELIPSVRAEQICFDLASASGDGEDQRMKPTAVISTGHDILSPPSLRHLINHFGDEAAKQPVVKKQLRHELFPGVHQLILVDVATADQHFGWLVAINCDMSLRETVESEFGTEEASLLSAAASVLATFASNLDLLHQKEQLLVDVVRSLVRAVEAKDEYTRGHSERVALYAQRLARRLELSEEECHQIYLTGLLHDIGKIGVPDRALKKPGKLTEEEYRLVQLHPVAGEAIVHDLTSLNYVLPGILHHHERYDGGGYPNGLAADQIPLPARILAVVDTFDAMTSDRPYRDGMPIERAITLLREGRNSQWDGEIVDAFQDILDSILTIRDSHTNESPSREVQPDQDRLQDVPPSAHGIDGSRRDGFTFVEILVVLLIMGIAAVVAVPKFAHTLETQKVHQAALRVKADLELARSQAQATSSSRSVLFDLGTSQYHLPGIASMDHPENVYRVQLAGPEYGVSVASAEFADSTDSDITFDGWGYPDSGGSIVIQSGSTVRSIVIDETTGIVSVFDVAEGA